MFRGKKAYKNRRLEKTTVTPSFMRHKNSVLKYSTQTEQVQPLTGAKKDARTGAFFA
jgi:hypothetical protein